MNVNFKICFVNNHNHKSEYIIDSNGNEKMYTLEEANEQIKYLSESMKDGYFVAVEQYNN